MSADNRHLKGMRQKWLVTVNHAKEHSKLQDIQNSDAPKGEINA